MYTLTQLIPPWTSTFSTFLNELILQLGIALVSAPLISALQSFITTHFSLSHKINKNKLLERIPEPTDWILFFRKIGYLCAEAFLLPLYYILLIIFFLIIILSILIYEHHSSIITYIWLCLALCGGTIHLFLSKKTINHIKYILISLFTVLNCSFLCIVLLYFTHNPKALFIISTFLVTITVFAIRFAWKRHEKTDFYHGSFVKIIRLVRYMIILATTISSIIWEEQGLFTPLNQVWIILWVIEYCMVLLSYDRKFIKIAIQLNTNNSPIFETQKAVFIYDKNKIKFITIDNKEMLIQESAIEKITYHLSRKTKKKAKPIICKFSNNTEKTYTNYTYLNNSWIKLYESSENSTEITILKDSQINAIIE